METVNYSLNNNIKYIIKKPDENEKNNIKLNTYNIEKKYNNTHLFDKHCIELYGNKTCILYHVDLLNIEVRLLDQIRYNKNYSVKYINKSYLYNEIPNLLKNNYTVVLVEKLLNTNIIDITSVHLPPNVKL
jgi:hypothetical protein